MIAGGTSADLRFMAAAIRLSRQNLGRTGTNPSVGTLIVRDDGTGPIIVGAGVTAVGGRPHAEAQALAEAGERAIGATAYVTLEPCAHHGRTPPCAEALVRARVARVVGAASDPDSRVSGKGYALLRTAGVAVTENVMAREAADLMAGYLTRSRVKRPEVTLKLAISSDGMLGRSGAEPVAITGEIARRQVHRMRAESDAILVGVATVVADDPQLNVRLPGLEARSPIRIVLDSQARLPLGSRLVATARDTPVLAAIGAEADPGARAALFSAGVELLATETVAGRVALPELLDDLAARGISTLFVEGGARIADSFLREGLVDRISLFGGAYPLGGDGVRSPIDFAAMPAGFESIREGRFGQDAFVEWVRMG